MTPPSTRAVAWEAFFTTQARLSERIEHELKARNQLSLAEYNVLLQVSRAPHGAIRPSVLARQVVFSPSRLTHTLHRLRDRGLLERRVCPVDARGGEVLLTEQGTQEFEQASAVHRELVRSLVLEDLSTEDEEVLSRVFSHISGRLDEDN